MRRKRTAQLGTPQPELFVLRCGLLPLLLYKDAAIIIVGIVRQKEAFYAQETGKVHLYYDFMS